MSRMIRWHQGGARLALALLIGCALLVLLCVAVSSAVAGAADSTGEGLSLTGQQLGASLVLPSVDQLLGGEQAQLARAARRSAPAEVARRAASRSAFEGLSSRAALAETARAFPALAHAGGVMRLASGERIVRYPTTHAAQVSLPGRVGVIEAIEPIAGTSAHGAHVPFDLTLGRAGSGYAPVRSPVELSVPSALSRGIELPQIGVSLVPIDRRGVALTAFAAQSDGAGVLWNVANDSYVHDLAAVAKAAPLGFDLSTMLFSQRSPSRLYFRIGMPAGARLQQKPDGAVWIVKGAKTIAAVSPVSAEDAEGSSVPTSVGVSGDVISVHVQTGGDYLYPITVDPEVNDSQLAKTSTGKLSNWEFQTNSTHFSKNESGGGTGSERLETQASGGYGAGEFAFWGYQTKGVSHIYEIKTETSAHNSGAKVESFLEFQEPPSGARETKKILSTPTENPEYERKPATLCAANASKVEECLPGSGKAGNSVHFGQAATGSSGVGFSDAMTQGIVSIAEPNGTHATTGYNTSSPTIEVEVEKEGKKEKVKRTNALLNAAHSWLSKLGGTSGGAIELTSSDPGIGVSATGLEYESSPGVWTPLEQHNYLAEGVCHGVQCYVTHGESWTLTPTLPDGEPKLRYRAEEAISGTQSLSSEGVTTVKVDSKKPHNLEISGLPFGNELSERPYELTVQATDGEGSTVASSGIKSIALFVDGHEVGTPSGSCTVAKGACTASTNRTVNGAELGAGKHSIEIVVLDNAGNEARHPNPVSVRHSTPVALGPGSVDLESGDFTLGAADISMGSGLTVGRNYSSRATTVAGNGPLGPQWSLSLSSSESVEELISGDVLLTSADGKQTIFAALGSGKFESPTGDSNLELSLEENKTTKQKLAYYLKNPAAHSSVKFTQPAGTPAGSKMWVPVTKEGTAATDTVTYSYNTTPAVSQYSVPGTGEHLLTGIAAGPDGNAWFIEHLGNKVGKINTSGGVTTYPLPAEAAPSSITSGPEGNLWFTEYKKIGMITPSGKITQYKAEYPETETTGIATGADGWLWYTEGQSINKINPSTGYTFTSHTLPANSDPTELALGPDGNIWFVDGSFSTLHRVGKITPAGVVTEYSLPEGSKPVDIAPGPAGSNVMWFTNAGTKKIGKVTTTGEVSEYALPSGGGTPNHLTLGPEGNMWFTAQEHVGKITPTGEISEYEVSRPSVDIAAGSDGNLWFTGNWTWEGKAYGVGSITPPGALAEPKEVRAPVPAGVSCSYSEKPTEMNHGCRALEFEYAQVTFAKGEARSEWGPFAGRLQSVQLVAYDPVSKTMRETQVAAYEYDQRGRLRAEWDPRVSPALKTTYGYDEEGHVTVMSPPGEEPWTFTYGAIAGDAGTGRLLKASRAPASSELWKGEAVASTEAPQINGSTTESVRLSATSGKWSGSPNGYSYQWRRCAAGGCSAIPGATNANYTAQPADVGYALLVAVQATNGDGSVAASSAETAAVKSLAGNLSEYALPSGSGPKSITAGPEAGTMWFTDFTSSKIGKSSSTGTITEYALPASSGPEAIAKGADGNLWVANYTSSKIAKVTASGAVTEYALPLNSHPKDIVAGPDGNLWFVEYSKSAIGKITTSGAITEYALPTNSDPASIAVGPDGNLWFTDFQKYKVGKITTSGTITEYAVPIGTFPMGITAGPDGNLWFVQRTTGKVGKITTSGTVTEYGLPFQNPEYITSAAGSLWVSGKGSKKLFRVSTAGSVLEYPLAEGSQPQEVAVSSLGEIWFAELNDKLAKFSPSVLAEGEAKAPEPGTTLNYGVPVSGTGAPQNMSPTEVANWGQSDDPVEATAITAADEPQGWPASSYKRATVYYLDEQGRQVNVASPSNATYGSITTTEYNEYNDVIRTLTPDNRATALASGASSAELSKLLDTQNTFNGEGAKEGEVLEPGTRLVESFGPQHLIKYVAGHEQKEAFGRDHKEFSYDQGAPGGETYDLATESSDLAKLANKEDVEVRTTKTSYSGQSNLGWKLRAPTSVTTIDPEGHTLTTSTTEYNPSTGQVSEVRGTAAEKTLSYASKFGEAGTAAGKLKAPWGVVVNSEGKLLVVDSANNRVEKFSAEGTYVSSFGEAGSGNGQLKEPQGIALDAAGHVWVADTGNNRIEEFSSAGAFMTSVGSLGSESGKFKAPSALAFDAKGNIWVADTGNSRIEKFDKEAKFSSEFGSAGSEPGKLAEPKGIALDSGEHVWVADTGNNRIQEFSASGSLLKRFGTPGAGEGQLNTPIDLKIDSQGNLWTLDTLNGRAESFTPSGAYLTQLGWRGSEAGQLSEPRALAFDATGKAWITDSADNRLEQWSKGPNAHDQKTIYYSAAANSEYSSCGSRPEWAGLVCETLPAKQPELMGLPKLPVTTYTYNMYDEPETVTETFGATTRTKKETYDAAGRRSSSETTASTGSSLPKVAFTYSSELGVLEKTTSTGEEKALLSEFNRLGQVIKYTDADGNVAKYKYAGPENDFLLTEASDSSAAGTSKQSYEYDATTRLRTKLIDSAAGSFTASYDAEGKLTSVSYPYSICANYSYNSVNEATSVQYLKSSNCSESEAGSYYSDTRLSSVRGEMLTQSSTLAGETYSYDASGRLIETQETPTGEGCTVRAYTYDEEANRAGSVTRTPGVGGACQTEGGSVESHNYDEGNHLADGGMAYDGLGNVIKLPAADAEGHELTSSFYVDNAVASQTQSGVSHEYKLDPEGRTREAITGSIKTINHYDSSGEAVAWSESPEKWVRNIAGVDGTLLATQTNGETPVLQLHDLQGDVVGTIGDKAGETKLLSTYNSSEFGVPTGGKAPPKLGYLGAFGVESSFSTGVITYGATSYVPQTGRALQSEAVEAPGTGGGSGAGAPYTMQEEPWNMQGAEREAAEAPGLEAAREQAALNAAEGTFVDPWVHANPMNRSKAASLAEEYWEAEAFAVVAAMNDIPTEAVEALGQKFGDFLSDFTDAYKWFYDAGAKLNKCAQNKRVANGRAVNICWFEYEEIEWTPGVNILGVQINAPLTLKFPNFSVEPIVNECQYVQGPSLVCIANVYIKSEL
jgi:YD repeat-containing protein